MMVKASALFELLLSRFSLTMMDPSGSEPAKVVSASSTLLQMLLKDRKPEWLPSFALLKGSHLRFF